MKQLKSIAYGVGDFDTLRKCNGYFVDRTDRIPLLENSRFCVFLRPRRFGKTLWLSILHGYYDILLADKFDECFSGTWIHEHPTPEHHSYMILHFNFSIVGGSPKDIQTNLNTYTSKVINNFVKKYSKYLSDDIVNDVISSPFAVDKLNSLSIALQGTDIPLYVMIDEYDNFTNNVMAVHGEQSYNELCHGDGCFKQFFNVLKAMTSDFGSPVKRIFITGVSPITMDDVTSGFNIGDNLSLRSSLADLLGFSHEDIQTMIDYYADAGALKIDRKLAFDTITSWYDNYRFSEDSDVNMANPQLVLYFFKEAIEEGEMPRRLFDENVQTDFAKLQHLVTAENRLNGNFTAIEHLISDSGAVGKLIRSFQLRELHRPENFISLLYYYGMVTIAGETFGDIVHFGIPNRMVELFVNQFITTGYSDAGKVNTRISEIARGMLDLGLKGSWENLMHLVGSVMHDCISVRDLQDGEKTVQATMNALLHASSCFIVRTEVESAGGFADVTVQPDLAAYPILKYAAIIELKYLKAQEKLNEEITQELLRKAAEQLERYSADHDLPRLWQLKPAGQVTLIKLAVIFHGDKMAVCQEIPKQ